LVDRSARTIQICAGVSESATLVVAIRTRSHVKVRGALLTKERMCPTHTRRDRRNPNFISLGPSM
jgi:hypothetical protein